jgi:hypothetical protein
MAARHLNERLPENLLQIYSARLQSDDSTIFRNFILSSLSSFPSIKYNKITIVIAKPLQRVILIYCPISFFILAGTEENVILQLLSSNN